MKSRWHTFDLSSLNFKEVESSIESRTGKKVGKEDEKEKKKNMKFSNKPLGTYNLVEFNERGIPTW